jgi:hypothetical protein
MRQCTLVLPPVVQLIDYVALLSAQPSVQAGTARVRHRLRVRPAKDRDDRRVWLPRSRPKQERQPAIELCRFTLSGQDREPKEKVYP